MGQKSSLIVMLSGIASFFTALGTFLTGHRVWSDVLTPEAIGHILIIVGSFAASIYGALSYQMNPPNWGKVSQEKLNELKGDKNV